MNAPAKNVESVDKKMKSLMETKEKKLQLGISKIVDGLMNGSAHPLTAKKDLFDLLNV